VFLSLQFAPLDVGAAEQSMDGSPSAFAAAEQVASSNDDLIRRPDSSSSSDDLIQRPDSRSNDDLIRRPDSRSDPSDNGTATTYLTLKCTISGRDGYRNKDIFWTEVVTLDPGHGLWKFEGASIEKLKVSDDEYVLRRSKNSELSINRNSGEMYLFAKDAVIDVLLIGPCVKIASVPFDFKKF
jgi:hypothetical protein